MPGVAPIVHRERRGISPPSDSSKPLMKSDRGRSLQEDRTRRGKKHQFPLGLHHLSDLPFKTDVLPPEGRAFEVTNRMVFAIAVPMTLAFLTTPLLGLVDTAVVGRSGRCGACWAGWRLPRSCSISFSPLSISCRSATTGLVAQAMGREDPTEEQAVFWRSLMICSCRRRSSGDHCRHAAACWRQGWRFMGAEGELAVAASTYLVDPGAVRSRVALANYAILGYILGRGMGKHRPAGSDR
jgi:MATE family multidrug resistance protein